MRLTKKVLEAIVDMAGQIEADGVEGIQGTEDKEEQEEIYSHCIKAGIWADDQLKKRKLKSDVRRSWASSRSSNPAK